jgi:putative endonuclease
LYYTYVLYSPKFDRIYIGQTDYLEKRLERHNLGLVRSTKAYVPWETMLCERFKTRSEALRREKELKSYRGREFIRDLIAQGS